MGSNRFCAIFLLFTGAVLSIMFLAHNRIGVCSGLTPAVSLQEAEYISYCAKAMDRKIAVVVPFLIFDIHKVATWISTFDSMKPCSEMCGAPNVDLVFYNNRDITQHPDIIDNITQTFEATEYGARCFRRVRFLSANLTDYEDYRSGLIHRGPRNMFWRAFSLMGGQYHYYFQNEPDIEPVRPNWVDKLINETLIPPFWIRGTVHKKRGDRLRKSPPEYWEHRMHLNGAALFNLHDERFTKDFIGRLVALPDEGPFDFAIENYTKDAANWEYMMNHLDKFQYADFIQNVINDNITKAEILEQFPDAYLVHGLGRTPGKCPSCENKRKAEEAAKKAAAEKAKAEADKAKAEAEKAKAAAAAAAANKGQTPAQPKT